MDLIVYSILSLVDGLLVFVWIKILKIWRIKMKVAIIGAGLSGLSCAHQFENTVIEPVIFERNNFIGDQYGHISAL